MRIVCSKEVSGGTSKAALRIVNVSNAQGRSKTVSIRQAAKH